MQDDQDQIRRRDFLRLGGSAIATAGLSTFLPAQSPQPTQQQLTSRSAPAHPLVLRSEQLEVSFDPGDGLPYEYRWRASGARLRGEDFGQKIKATICRRKPWRFFYVDLGATPAPRPKAAHTSAAAFSFTAKDGATDCASFRIVYELRGGSLKITLDKITEQNEYEFISAAMPRLVTVREEDGQAWLVYGDSGGNLVMLADANPGTLPPNRFWGRIHGSLPVTMVGTEHLLCVQETTAFMDTTEVAIAGSKGGLRASIGSGRAHRVNGGACYDLNLGTGAPLNCGNQSTPNLLIDQTPSCRLDFLPVSGDPRNAWLRAAKLVRDRMPEIPNSFYHDKYIYGIRCDEPHFPQPSATFAECEQVNSDVADLTDGSPQIVHLWGWQFNGKDTGYPAVNVVDDRIGGYDGMMRVMERGHAHNATVTLSDNYDDAYKSSPAWNEVYIARRPDGQLWQSRAWTGEVSFIQGLAKYMEGPGVERVRYTCERYKLPRTTHIDVLSYYAIRNDWDPQHPASGIRNLFEGRYRILKEFAKHGVDVTSEGLRYPMIGHISCCWYAQTSETSPLGGTPIPLLPMVYGKSAIWGMANGMRGEPFDLRARHLFWGANIHDILRASTDRKQITDVFYLIMVPWLHLHRREITSFHRDGQQVAIGYEGGARVEIDNDKKTYRVLLGDSEIANEQSVYAPLDENRLCFYSLNAQELTAPLPTGWSESEAVAAALSVGQRHQAKFTVRDGHVQIQVAAQQPVILYRNRAISRL